MKPAAAPLTAVADARPDTAGPVRCAHFGPCGGCSFLDAPYADELALKADAFRRVAEAHLELEGVELRPPLAAREPLFYRTSLKVPFALKRGRPVSGFFERGSHRIVDLHECAIQHPALTRLLLGARELAARQHTQIYDERTHKGLLRHFVARSLS